MLEISIIKIFTVKQKRKSESSQLSRRGNNSPCSFDQLCTRFFRAEVSDPLFAIKYLSHQSCCLQNFYIM